MVLNVKIRNHLLGTLPALGTVRRSWKDELNRVKTSHPLWRNRSQKSSLHNSFLPANSIFRDVSLDIWGTRTNWRVPLCQACLKRPGGHFEVPKSYIHPFWLCSGKPQALCKSTTSGPFPSPFWDPPPCSGGVQSVFRFWRQLRLYCNENWVAKTVMNWLKNGVPISEGVGRAY